MQHILSKMRKAIEDYNMIDEGDKIAVCLSGGKDSITMLNGLKALQRFYPKHFDLIAITVNPGFENFNKDILQKLVFLFLLKILKLKKLFLMLEKKKILALYVLICVGV